jgi:cob(I)alamin adenosyltransferase
MGNRLSKIYTRTGDKGSTGLGDGTRVDKDSLRVEAYGTTDELNSVIGMVLSEAEVSEPLRGWLFEVQHDLFDLGAELCVPGHVVLTEAFVQRLEQHIDAMNVDSFCRAATGLPPPAIWPAPFAADPSAGC